MIQNSHREDERVVGLESLDRWMKKALATVEIKVSKNRCHWHQVLTFLSFFFLCKKIRFLRNQSSGISFMLMLEPDKLVPLAWVSCIYVF